MSALRLVERPRPEIPGAGWVRLRTILGGVCGTDLGLISLRNHPATILQQFASFPAVLGHENVAVIDAVGEGVSGWTAGQRVCADPAIGCEARGVRDRCCHCVAGRVSLCEYVPSACGAVGEAGGFGAALPPRAMLGLNVQTGGSWAGYFLAHQSQLHAVPKGVSDEAAVLVDPVASAAHAVLRRRPMPGETVLVHGGGIIGLGVLAALRALGHDNRVTMVVRHAFQAELAGRFGATRVVRVPGAMRKRERYMAIAEACGGARIDGSFGNQILVGGFDLTYECTGDRRGLTAAMKWTQSRGVVVAAGTTGIARIDTTPIWFDELQVLGSNGRQVENVEGRELHTYELVFEWLAGGRMDLSVIRVARYRLAEYRRAFYELLDRRRRGIVKAAFEPEAD